MNDRLIHDLRHWLTALLGALDTGNVGLARGIAEQMTGLLGEHRVAAVSLNAAMALLRAPGVRVELAAPDVFVRADPAGLGRVLMNLTVNARQAEGSVTLRAGQDGTVAVEDAGPGMPPEVLARSCEPGFTTRGKAGGNGLGLAIVREVVKAAGGTVTVESAVGHGTTVTVRWQLADRDEKKHLPLKEGGIPLPTFMTVLLVEDEPVARHLAERALRQAGWNVVAVGSAEDALAAAETLTPDAVVADLTLPGMDGRALIAALRARWPKLPAVLVSGYADSARQADLTDEKAVFLAKPYTLACLAATVATAVRD